MKQFRSLLELRRLSFFLALLAGGVLAFAPASLAATEGDTAASNAQVRESYVIPLFATDRVLRDPNERVSSSFELSPKDRIDGNAELDLHYSWSPITLPGVSTLTVSVNNTPVDSRILKPLQIDESEWQVQVPGRYFRPGDNTIEISVVHRTIDGPCRDIDNDANWFIVRPETRLGFVLSRGAYGISDFPRPYSDPWSSSKTDTLIYIPSDCDDDTLSAAMDMAAFLGRNGEAGSLPDRLEVRTDRPAPSGANEIVLGKTDDWFPDVAKTVSPDVPVLTFQPLPDGHSRLYITANDSPAFFKALTALKNPQLVNTFTDGRVVLSAPLSTKNSEAGAPYTGDKTIFTLDDLGYTDDIAVTGAFHQEAYAVLPRPANYRAGEGSYIEFHFRHSQTLEPRKSAVTVYIDDIPMRAAPLLPQNADGGVLNVPIPASELNKPWWTVRFAFYHDLGVVDCSKRYDEAAWSVVEKSTALHLKPGAIPYLPTWDCFPGDFLPGADGHVDLTLLLKDRPGPSDLNSAAMLAWYVGSANGSDIRWHVQRSGTFDAKAARGTIVALGSRDDPAIWKPLENALPVCPVDGGYRIAPGLNLVPETLKNFDICEIGRVGDAKADKRVYAFLLAPDSRLLTTRPLGDLHLSGQISLTGTNGLVTAIQRPAVEKKTPGGADDKSSTSWLSRIYDIVRNAPKSATAVYLYVLGAVALLTLIVTILTWKKR